MISYIKILGTINQIFKSQSIIIIWQRSRK